MSQVKAGDNVQVHYTGKLKDNTVFDSSQNREPLAFEVGSGQMIPGFDQGVLGMSVGESKTIEIPASEAYGERRDDLVLSVSKDKMPKEMNPSIGDQLQINQPNGQAIPVTVTEITDENITLDANHQLAGKDLIFDIELVQIG